MNTAQEPYSLSLSGVVPECACYKKTQLKRVYGTPLIIESNAFNGCTALQDINLQNITSIGGSAFNGCTALQGVYISSNSVNFKSSSFQFMNCSALERVIMSRITSLNGGSIFEGDYNLKYVDLRTVNSMIYSKNFYGCTSLVLLDFTACSSAPSIATVNTFSNTNNTWIAVVANDTVKAAFQSATNWSTYASHIKTIAEVEAEVGMTYDEYYLQCFGHPRFD